MKKKNLIFLLFFVLIFSLLSLKIANFSLRPEEEEIVKILNEKITAIDGKTKVFNTVNFSRWRQGSVFTNVLLQATYQFAGQNLFLLRFLQILAFLFSLLLFFFISRQLVPNNYLLLIALILTSFTFWPFAGKLTSEIWFSLFALLSFWAGFRFFLEENNQQKFWWGYPLSLSYLLLPTVHFFALIHLFVLDIALIGLILWQRKKWSRNLFELFLLNLLLLGPLSVWADATIMYFQKLNLSQLPNLTTVFHQLWGKAGWLGFIGLGLVLLAILAGLRKVWLSKNLISSREYFFGFLVFYLILIFISANVFPFIKASLGENYLFLFWPILFILFIGLPFLWEKGKRNKELE